MNNERLPVNTEGVKSSQISDVKENVSITFQLPGGPILRGDNAIIAIVLDRASEKEPVTILSLAEKLYGGHTLKMQKLIINRLVYLSRRAEGTRFKIESFFSKDESLPRRRKPKCYFARTLPEGELVPSTGRIEAVQESRKILLPREVLVVEAKVETSIEEDFLAELIKAKNKTASENAAVGFSKRFPEVPPNRALAYYRSALLKGKLTSEDLSRTKTILESNMVKAGILYEAVKNRPQRVQRMRYLP